ncbi:nucleotidyltransferase family protein [Chamaesiphon sp. VAR_48_metabat_135_sub]|uniref:nucleotidyltransferase family protein n=1 Tax=Chamaesiphon sp. VAR_48_metabat_135_sub TaxID=2964699 RepID=UPI00286BBCAD|nr:nucleotidyltransferase family protein [Chamaesiphon sp. VAR_48_metabat_135_sub]
MQIDSHNSQIAAVILAAGASTRMGTPKQLLEWQGRSLLRSITETAIAADCDPIIIVLGASSDRMQAEIIDLPVQIVNNPEWQTGMGSSIRTGIQALLDRNMDVNAAILLLCDQPFVSVQIIRQLRSIYATTHQSIVASSYRNTIGVPALFDRQLFPELLKLDCAEGAKRVIKNHPNATATIDFPQGSIDIDTPKDYQQILSNLPMSAG